MNESVKKKWIKALNSGKYAQGKGRLRQEDNFCCLGVLCDLYDEKGWKKWSDGYSYRGDSAVLPSAVSDWAGLINDNPNIGRGSLSNLNDSGKTFKEIANLIEEYL